MGRDECEALWRFTRMLSSGRASLVPFMIMAVCAFACTPDEPATAQPASSADGIERATQLLTEQLRTGMPWESVRAKVIRVHRIEAISVRATVRLNCPNVRIVPHAPVPKDTGMRDFARLDLIEVDRLVAHHIEAGEIVADEIVATKVDAPTYRGP